jgi:hypothetical protein
MCNWEKSKDALESIKLELEQKKDLDFGYGKKVEICSEYPQTKEEEVNGVCVLIGYKKDDFKDGFYLKLVGALRDGQDKDNDTYDIINLNKYFSEREDLVELAKKIARQFIEFRKSIYGIYR